MSMRPGEPIAGATIPHQLHVRDARPERLVAGCEPRDRGPATADTPLPRQVTPCYHSVALSGHSVGAWRSLVARIVRDDEVGGSNPLAPTIRVVCAYPLPH